ncbi:MAG: hypothetical protein CMJ48_01255 [Planctomycetaceae bacterium]|nr:hypothetical protein [Planctomycetaceae bacterium]
MPFDVSYDCDTEFVRLLSRDARIDLPRACLELARDASPALDFRQTTDWIAARGEELAAKVARAWPEQDALRSLAFSLGTDHGLGGNERCRDRADLSYLNRVIETGMGTPVSLSVLYMAVAERVGLELTGVAAPTRFLTRFETTDGPLFLDAYDGGTIHTWQDCVARISAESDLSPEQIALSLSPAEPRSIVVRMLNDLKQVHTRMRNWDQSWLVQYRLAALMPSSYRERRDLALVALKANKPGEAVELLGFCLKTCPSNEQAYLTEQYDNACGALAKCN